MNNSSVKTVALFMLVAALAALIAACAGTASMAVKHPVAVDKMPICADCHTDGRAALSHTPDFSTRHRFYAAQQNRTCAVCHKESFCADCHADKEELKPSDKYKDSPERTLPHRGDYISQHKIDGKLNPVSCFPCHGRQNNERCRACHR